MTKDKALKLALDFIERVNKDGWLLADFEPEMYVAITAIKEALAQPEQDVECKYCTDGCPACDARKLPPQRTWIGLTDDEVMIINRKSYDAQIGLLPLTFYRAIESALREKNT